MSKLLDAIDGARWVEVRGESPETRIVYVWHGGHTVNVYSHRGEPLDCFSRYGPGGEAPDLGEVQSMIDDYYSREH